MKKISIIPKPLSLSKESGSFELKEPLTLFDEFGSANAWLKEISNFEMARSKEECQVAFLRSNEFSSEEYSISCSPTKIVVTAFDEAGAFYAVKTLSQLIFDGSGKKCIQCCVVHDKPQFEMRSFMLDEARHFFGKDFVKNLLDIMSMLKLNTFHWHLSDDQGWRIEIKKHPILAKKGSIRSKTQLNVLGSRYDNQEYGRGCYYSQKDIKEIVEYAQQRFIEIIPEIDMPGHMMAAIACYPQLSCTGEKIDVCGSFGVKKTICCCGNDFTYDLAKDVLDEISELFPGHYVHIGGDEVPKKMWKSCNKCQEKMKNLNLKNEKELHGYFISQMCKILKAKGKQGIVWNEALGCNIDNDVVVQWWTGGAEKNGVKQWVDNGGKIIVSQVQYLYMDHFYAHKDILKSYSLDFNKLQIDQKHKKNILGIEAPQWTEYVRTKGKFDFNTFPRLQVLSELNWTSEENKKFDDFINRLPGFETYLNSHNVSSAPKQAFLCSGGKGFIRRLFFPIRWLLNPNYEFNKFI